MNISIKQGHTITVTNKHNVDITQLTLTNCVRALEDARDFLVLNEAARVSADFQDSLTLNKMSVIFNGSNESLQ